MPQHRYPEERVKVTIRMRRAAHHKLLTEVAYRRALGEDASQQVIIEDLLGELPERSTPDTPRSGGAG